MSKTALFCSLCHLLRLFLVFSRALLNFTKRFFSSQHLCVHSSSRKGLWIAINYLKWRLCPYKKGAWYYSVEILRKVVLLPLFLFALLSNLPLNKVEMNRGNSPFEYQTLEGLYCSLLNSTLDRTKSFGILIW